MSGCAQRTGRGRDPGHSSGNGNAGRGVSPEGSLSFLNFLLHPFAPYVNPLAGAPSQLLSALERESGAPGGGSLGWMGCETRDPAAGLSSEWRGGGGGGPGGVRGARDAGGGGPNPALSFTLLPSP